MAGEETHRFKHGEHCTVEGCRSKRYYIDSGLRFCAKRGHQQEGFTQVLADEDDFGTQGRKSRKKKEDSERVHKVLSGKEATELFLQCWQLVLWKQVSWLRDVKGLPGELETVVRDLWSVRLRAVKGFRNDSAAGGDGSSVWYSSSEAQTDSDGMESASVGSGLSRVSRSSVRRRTKSNGLPKLIDTLGLCYLGTLLMRLPISLGDLHRWAEREEILFLRVVREIPKEMRARLPGYYVSALETRAPLRRDDLHKAVLELTISFKERFEFVFPPLNAPLILFKHVRDLCLPLEIYAGVQRLARALKLSFSFPDYLGRHRVTAYPEIQMVALIIIATKLAYPFDDIPRVPESMADPSALSIDWKLWQESFSEEPSEGLKKGQPIDVQAEDVFQMSEERLDDYLDWYQSVWVDDKDSKIPQQIIDFAPLNDPPPERRTTSQLEIDTSKDRLLQIQSNLIWHKPVAPKDGEVDKRVHRPGSLYRHYRTVEDLPHAAKIFYDKAAENAGISLATLVKAVFATELQLQGSLAAGRREKYMDAYSAFDDLQSDGDSEVLDE